MEVPLKGIHSSLNLPETSAPHSKPQTGTILHKPLESSLEGEKNIISGCNCFSSKRYLQGGWCPALTATATRHGESSLLPSFAICAAGIPIFHLAGGCHNHQATGYSGLRNGGHSDHLMEAVLHRGYWNTHQQREKVCKRESLTPSV